MRSLSMFSRLLIVSLSVVLVCVAVLSGLAYANLKSRSISNRMDALKTQARDIGYLAGRLSLPERPLILLQSAVGAGVYLALSRILRLPVFLYLMDTLGRFRKSKAKGGADA